MTFTIEPFSNQSFELGEGPHWHPILNRLFFVDITKGIAATIDADKNIQILLEENDTLSMVIPVDNQPDQVVVAIGTSVYLFNTTTGEKTLIDQITKQGVRFNDAKCDPYGRLWIGTMGLESSPGVLEPELGLSCFIFFQRSN